MVRINAESSKAALVSLSQPKVVMPSYGFDSAPSPTFRRLCSSEIVVGSPDFGVYSNDKRRPKSPARERRRASFSFEKTEQVRTFLWRTVYTIFVIMWVGAYRKYRSAFIMYGELLSVMESDIKEYSEAEINLKNLKIHLRELQEKLIQVSNVNAAFNHELRMIREMAAEPTVDMHMTVANMSNKGTVSKWIFKRRQGLEHRIEILRKQVQEQSKLSVLENYGRGPYRIKFKVQAVHDSQADRLTPGFAKPKSEFSQNLDMRAMREFIVELAPLDTMPHSISLFLDTVKERFWDNSIFVHHDESEHILTAAPIDYLTHNQKDDLLDSIHPLNFPEYSPTYPHEKYTLGFAERGPTFYINIMDNSQEHGPAGQDHYLLPGDAEPCFGRVVQGREVIDLLANSGIQADNRINPKASHPWKDQEDLYWTRIISAEIL